jgi:hypothetical protein
MGRLLTIKHFRYAPHKPLKGGGFRIMGQQLAGPHAHYSSLVEIKPKKKRRRDEDATQRAIVHLLEIHKAQGRLVYFAVPNGERRDKITGAKLKRQGVVAGAPDLVICVKLRPPIFVEVKSKIGRSSKAQIAMAEAMKRGGHRYEIVRSVEDIAEIIR